MTEKFQKAYLKTMWYEGGYVCDPDDTGGETYRGISRRFHPSWPGWDQVDRAKNKPNINQSLENNTVVQIQTKSFYKSMFWDRFIGDEISEFAPTLAFELFDTAVNMGVHRAVTFLQQGLNRLNRNGQIFDDIAEDGVFGSATLAALKEYTRHDRPSYLKHRQRHFQGGIRWRRHPWRIRHPGAV